MRFLAALALASLPFCADGVSAQTPPPAQVEKAQCDHISEEFAEWLRTMGYGLLASYSCSAVSFDFDRSVTFHNDEDGGAVQVRFEGVRANSPDTLEVETIEPRFDSRQPAKGFCRLIVKGGVEPRRIQCFASRTTGDSPEATVVEAVLADESPADAMAQSRAGGCDQIGVARLILLPALAKRGEPPPEATILPRIECSTFAIEQPGIFSFFDTRGELQAQFRGREKAPGNIELETVILADGLPRTVEKGFCHLKRNATGSLDAACAAATGGDGKLELVEVWFHPDPKAGQP